MKSIRKTQRHAQRDEISNLSLNNIENNVDRYISRRKRFDSIRKWFSVSAVILFAALLLTLYAEPIYLSVEELLLSENELILKEKAAELREKALSVNPVILFSEVAQNFPANVPGEAKYAFLIHRFNNDFYGRSFKLDIKDERLLYTHMTYAGFDMDDPVRLNKPFSDDSSQTVKEWLFKKTGTSPVYSAYFNPVFQKLDGEIKEIEDQLQEKINAPFSAEMVDSVIKLLPDREYSASKAEQDIINILSGTAGFLDEEQALQVKLMEKQQELNIRLGLFRIFLGHEYDAQNTNELFGWLSNDYKGKNFFSKRRRIPVDDQEKVLYASAKEFSDAFDQNNILYKKLDLQNETVQLYNPLQMPLEVKSVGLFNAHRRNERGRSYKHRGVDLMADEGTPVYPVREGFVIFVGKTYGNGNFIKIWHDNQVVSSYSHLKNDAVWQRSIERFKHEGPFWVNTLDAIASVGTTGNIPKNDEQYGYAHLHLEVTINDKLQNPLTLFNEAYQVFQE
ncbi:MAG: M23 family metallopeptidase [Calditrichae bacterium]|nr:M23 family metallopeptidase [Calditrichia bacterium]